jgi:hypothetical protein
VRVGQALTGKANSVVGRIEARNRKGDSLFADYATVLVPLGLAIWIAFTLSFTLTNLSYAWSALSDPFGWGWNLFGTANMAWTPYLSGVIPYLQVPVLLVGLIIAVALGFRTAAAPTALRGSAFVSAFVGCGAAHCTWRDRA